MNAELEHPALVAAMRLSNRPPHHLAERLEEAGSAQLVLERELAGGDRPQLVLPDPADLLRAARDDLDRWRRQGIRIIGVLDSAYPPNLRLAHDRPPAIFLAGELHDTDARAVAVIGSRHPSASGSELAGVISTHLKAMEYVVLSGLAQGIDTAAHAAALRAGGRTLAVIGSGLHHQYPPQNAHLQQEIVRQGAVVSQFWPEAPPTRQRFPQRNALMSGMALASVIVEAGPRSGTRIQARAALAHNRPVFLGRAVLEQQWARELAERPGVHVIDAPSQLTDRLAERESTGALHG